MTTCQANTRMSKIVVTTWGSLGDLHPYMAIALGLQKRGHDVVVATSSCYRQKIESLGLSFRPVRLCDTGGARRTWLRSLQKVQKRYLSAAMAFNLGRILRSLLGADKPRHLAALAESCCFIYIVMWWRPNISTSHPVRLRRPNATNSHILHFLAA